MPVAVGQLDTFEVSETGVRRRFKTEFLCLCCKDFDASTLRKVLGSDIDGPCLLELRSVVALGVLLPRRRNSLRGDLVGTE